MNRTLTPREHEAAEAAARQVPNAVKKVQLAILAAVLVEIESIGKDGAGTSAGHSWGNVALASRSFYNLSVPHEHPSPSGAS